MRTEMQKIKPVGDLSYIGNLDDLEAKIREVRLALRTDEQALKAGFKNIPVEAIRSTFGNVVPFFAKTPVAEKSWNIVQTILSLLIHNPEKKNFKGIFDKNNIQYILKRIAIFVGINFIKSYLAKRKKNA